MRVAGIDVSTFAVDVVLVGFDTDAPPEWHRFPLIGSDAFDRTRSVADAMHGRASVFWDEILAVGIEHPAGHHGVGPLLRIQGAVLACIPSRVLVEPWPPGKWRTAVGLPGNASKDMCAQWSWDKLSMTPPPIFRSEYRRNISAWPNDAHDAHLIALATRQALNQQEAA